MEPLQTSGSPAADRAVVSVLIPLPLDAPYDYGVPSELHAVPGQFVIVPLGVRQVIGVVWGPGRGDIDPKKIKDIIEIVDMPPMTEELRALVDWTASYTLSPPGSVLRMTMSVRGIFQAEKPVIAYATTDLDSEKSESDVRITPARQRVLRVLAGGKSYRLADLARAARVTPSVVHGLVAKGLVEQVTLGESSIPAPDPAREGPVLSPAQADAVASLTGKVGQGFSVTLLDGVTGAGKTEVYFEAIAATLKAGAQALVMLPEIALTADWRQRFERRFGAAPVPWHSDLTATQRRRAWRAVASGEARIVVGARSALFLPYPNLGLIVVDEEHDSSFKQEDGVIYNARDMAVVRGRLGAFPLVLVSATPSLETVVNCGRGRYVRVRLPQRHGGAQLPDVAAIDMRQEDMASQSWISPTLGDALAETLEGGEQTMLFLNRRGYAPLTLCRACGHRLECPQCTAWLVEHRLAGTLQCHHCGYAAPPPASCPSCGAVETFAACGPGVERLAEEVTATFQGARLEIMASDTIRGPAAAEELVRRMRDREIDILIGTQIMAKGHHFPLLTLVGVVDADLGLAGGDLRAAERSYQLLHQVSGRAGRADRPGRVLLQTYMPEHPVMEALISGQRDAFMAAEAAARESHAMPPFGRLAALIVSGPDEAVVEATARGLRRLAPEAEGVAVLGPAPAPLAVLRGRHRRRLLMKAKLGVNVQGELRGWLSRVRVPNNVRVQVDVDPYSFL